MLKNYINVRVFVLLDLSLAATWIMLSIGGWSVIKDYPKVDAIVWGIISIPLALIGVVMIYHRANLVHRKHVNIQYIYEQEQEIRLAQLRRQSLPYSTAIDEENIVSAHSLNAPVKPSGHLPDGRTRTGGQAGGQVIDEETDREADKRKVLLYVQQFPRAGYREIGQGVGFGRTKVGELINELK